MGYCQGVPQDGKCSTDADCNPGLYCATPTCAPLLPMGSPCTGTNQCVMNTGCTNKVCTTYYSLDSQAVDTECGKVGIDFIGFPLPVGSAPNYSVFCKSGTCALTAGGGGTCTDPLHSTDPLPVKCVPGEENQCLTDNGVNGAQGSITGSTKCVDESYNPQGETYCSLDIGDPAFTVFIQWVTDTWMPLLSGTNQYCHTSMRGINTACLLRMGGQYLVNEYTLVSEDAVNYAMYQGADVCTVQVFLPDYFSAQQYNAFCDTSFKCASEATSFSNNVGCIQQTPYAAFTIRPCTDPVNTVCPPVQIYQANKEVVCVPGSEASGTMTGLLPGDICESNGQCLSNVCTNGLCLGMGSGDSCPNGSSDCNPGFYCNQVTTKCAALIAAGAATQCYHSSDCEMGAGCNFSPKTGAGSCVTYYSVSKGGSVSDCGQPSFVPEYGPNAVPQGSSYYVKYSALCKSGTCALTSGTQAGAYAGECVSAYHSQGALPQTCNFGPTDCPMVNDDNGLTYGECMCGMSGEGKTKVCSVDFLDQPWVEFSTWAVAYFTNFTTYYPSSCHTYRRAFDPLCMSKLGGQPRVMQYQEHLLYATLYPLLINSANCTQQVYHPQYFTAYQYNRPYTPELVDVARGLALIAIYLVY